MGNKTPDPTIAARISPELHDFIKRRAEAKGLKVSVVIRQMLESAMRSLNV